MMKIKKKKGGSQQKRNEKKLLFNENKTNHFTQSLKTFLILWLIQR